MRPVCGKKEELSDDTRSIGERMYRKVVRKLNFVADGFRIHTALRDKNYIYAHTVGACVGGKFLALYRENLTSSREKIYRLIVFYHA